MREFLTDSVYFFQWNMKQSYLLTRGDVRGLMKGNFKGQSREI